MIWMYLLALFAQNPPAPPPEALSRDKVRELIYQAEVFGLNAESMSQLKVYLAEAPENLRPHIIQAMAMVKYGQKQLTDTDTLLQALQQPQAIIRHNGQIYIMAGGTWLEASDWVGSYFLLDVKETGILLQNREGLNQDVTFLVPLGAAPEDGLCLLRDAPISSVLPFLARSARLNNFSPSNLNTTISGTFPVVDWLGLLDSVCREAQVVWTRLRDNVIFSYAPQANMPKRSFHEALNRKNQDLNSFFNWLTESFSLELVTDVSRSDLKAIRVDIEAQDQSWDETLDCLALMNGFSWVLIEDGEKPKILLTRDPKNTNSH